jgi:hypothetical protein
MLWNLFEAMPKMPSISIRTRIAPVQDVEADHVSASRVVLTQHRTTVADAFPKLRFTASHPCDEFLPLAFSMIDELTSAPILSPRQARIGSIDRWRPDLRTFPRSKDSI